MKRIASKIDSMTIVVVRWATGGFYGTLRRNDDLWIWSCSHTHRTESGARECVRRELKRWVA